MMQASFPRWGEDISPEEFDALYGQPVPTTYNLTVGATLSIQPNPKRYLLAFWSAPNAIVVYPNSTGISGYSGVPLNTANGPIIFSWYDTMTLCCLGFTVTSAFNQPLTIVEGIMNYELLARIKAEQRQRETVVIYSRRRR